MWNVALIFVAKSSGEFQNLPEVILGLRVKYAPGKGALIN